MRKSDNTLLRWLGLAALAALVAALPFIVHPYQLIFLIFLLINIILVVSYRFVTITGEWSLIHVVMMGVGAYTSAILAKDLDLSVWLAMPLGGVAAALIAYVLSFPLFRMKGFYFLIGSFAAGEAIRLTWNQFREPFGGPKGIKLIPSPELTLPGLETIDLTFPPINYYFLTAIIMALCLWIMYRLEKSRIGLTLNAIHWKDVLAESVGVDVWRYRMLAFVTGSFFAGIAGALLAHYIGTINPDRFGLAMMLYVLVWTIVGGTATFAGPIIGVVALSVLDEAFRAFDQFRPAIYGVLLILTVRFLPNGLEALPAKLLGLRDRLTGGPRTAAERPRPASGGE
ncbi:branched-chain amino acid ABC transporter permease [Virgifigura deserti]|uniref:branched-chain amino acid ABC transporter permease n=1 Tax=Virgifigura deserti TaxID=2268457 RepID=UPI003CCC233F